MKFSLTSFLLLFLGVPALHVVGGLDAVAFVRTACDVAACCAPRVRRGRARLLLAEVIAFFADVITCCALRLHGGYAW